MAKLKRVIVGPAVVCIVIVLTFVIEVILPGNFSSFGIQVRSLSGLSGIFFSPFIHSGLAHLTANVVPLFIMGCMLSALDVKRFVLRTVLLILISGLLTWLVSSPATVIGASGLVFAFWSFLIFYGFKRRTLKNVSISAFTIIVYGAMLFSLFKYLPGISWAAHISGAVAGVLLANWETRKATNINSK